MLTHHYLDQSWIAFPTMSPDEGLLLKTFSSGANERVRCAIHTAFDKPLAPATAKLRESIERRVFVFF